MNSPLGSSWISASGMDISEELSQDSGLESPHSKANTPERKNQDELSAEAISFLSEMTSNQPSVSKSAETEQPAAEVSKYSPNNTESYDDEPDESLAERLWGLTEMFPDCVVNATHTVTTKTWSGVKSFYSLSRNLMWIAASSSVILFAPVFFELEIAKIEEKQKSEQKQYLLGPSAAMIGSGATPPMPR